MCNDDDPCPTAGVCAHDVRRISSVARASRTRGRDSCLRRAPCSGVRSCPLRCQVLPFAVSGLALCGVRSCPLRCQVLNRAVLLPDVGGCLRRWALRRVAKRSVDGGGARRSRGAGWRGLPSRSCVPRSATACGLRATSLGARRPGGRRKVAGNDTLLATGRPHSPARTPPPRFARRPWPPARLAAPEIARRQPPPPRSTTTPRLEEQRLKCARGGEREVQARVATAQASCRPLCQRGVT